MIVKKKESEPIKTILVITVGMLIVYMTTKWNWAIYTSVFIGLSGIISTYLAKKNRFYLVKINLGIEPNCPQYFIVDDFLPFFNSSGSNLKTLW